MSRICFKDVSKIYENNHYAVQNFNLTIDKKEFIILVGPSGCGKSTLLKMVAGFEKLSNGSIEIDGKIINDIRPKDREISMIFQDYAVYPHMSVYDNICFSIRGKKYDKDKMDKLVKDACKMLDLEEVLYRKCNSLSGGQSQRVAIGRAIVSTPKVFLMDEPLSNLDARLRVQMRYEISNLYRNLDSTIIYVTHDQVEAMTLGTKIVVMRDGIINQVGTSTDLYNDPYNMFVAGFIGYPSMNFIEGLVRNIDGSMYFLLGEKKIRLPKKYIQALCKKYDNKNVILGFRSEDAYLLEKKSDLECIFNIGEFLGSETYLYVDLYGNKVVVKSIFNNNLVYGKRYGFFINLDKVHFFDKESEVCISNNLI